ncbi:hypothetical protein [Afifella marina]|uniref:Uncharacterized protein n=1 Tax=Afifella marina DSM 2698 TaxID=1120955 RepID=A0A1G5MG89_AFIMA|nr:hypothetical protein [Afifella marina]MBK1625369.1 hypothetical protein [Afifella marina DSM 2698]MBK5916912.1 hypothetical protein [Afifella marina]SCZ24217.1 hypothetical protein SAMN03080610_00656 [Afifella marina DSM 2698]
MARKPKEIGTLAHLAHALAEFGSRLGRDTLVFVVLAVGAFGAMSLGADEKAVAYVATLLLLGWLVNKLVNAYLRERAAARRLLQLRQERGVRLLEKYSEKQARFRFKGGKSSSETESRDND